IRLLGILVDGHADAGHTRRVRHREIVAGLDRDLAPHLDLPAEVHQERAVGDIDDADTGHGPDLLHDLLGVAFVARLEAEIACDAVGAEERVAKDPVAARTSGDSCRGLGLAISRSVDAGRLTFSRHARYAHRTEVVTPAGFEASPGSAL